MRLRCNTVHFGGADHRTLWSAAFGERPAGDIKRSSAHRGETSGVACEMQFVSRVANAQEKPQRDPRRHAQKGQCTVPSLARVAHAAESKAQLTPMLFT